MVIIRTIILYIFTQVVFAISIDLGKQASIQGTTAERRPELAGVVLVDQIRSFSSSSDTVSHSIILVSGTLQDRVVRRDKTGTLDFYSRIMVDSSSIQSVVGLERQGFLTTSALDIDWRPDGVGT